MIIKFKKIYILFLIFFCITIQTAFCSAFEYGYTSDGFKYVIHKHNESSYQHVWCSEHKGIEEYENSDFTRVDCLTDTHAVEFDFACVSRCGVSVSCCVSNTSRTRNTTMAT